MNNMLLKMYVKFQDLANREEGQDLVEYALVAAIISLGCVVILGTVASALVTKFTAIAAAITAAP
jgi:Flp pilus assembly pilin Flp